MSTGSGVKARFLVLPANLNVSHKDRLIIFQKPTLYFCSEMLLRACFKALDKLWNWLENIFHRKIPCGVVKPNAVNGSAADKRWRRSIAEGAIRSSVLCGPNSPFQSGCEPCIPDCLIARLSFVLGSSQVVYGLCEVPSTEALNREWWMSEIGFADDQKNALGLTNPCYIGLWP